MPDFEPPLIQVLRISWEPRQAWQSGVRESVIEFEPADMTDPRMWHVREILKWLEEKTLRKLAAGPAPRDFGPIS